MRNIAFSPLAFKEYNEWFTINIQMTDRIKLLIRDIERDQENLNLLKEPSRVFVFASTMNIDLFTKFPNQILIVKCKGHY